MISARDFVSLWTKTGNRLVFPPEKEVEQLAISKQMKTWLVKAGLPKEAAPFLTFGPQHQKGWFPSISDLYHLPFKYSIYRVIGSNGAGDPICIDESENGKIICLSHDAGFTQTLLNSSIPQLAESLLFYREFVKLVTQKRGEDAYLDGDIPADIRAQTAMHITEIDNRAMEPDSFWFLELQQIVGENQL